MGLVPAAHADWLTESQNIMGTRCSVELWSDDAARGRAAIASVFADMHRIDRLMSTWKEDTEISLVNREGSKHPVKVSEELFRLLQESVRYSELTRGAFDITYASVGYLYDFKKGVHPDRKAIDAALPGVDWRQMVLDEKTFTVFFKRPGMRIDLGGIPISPARPISPCRSSTPRFRPRATTSAISTWMASATTTSSIRRPAIQRARSAR
jgi:thiamine biosynthesis lipoprotein